MTLWNQKAACFALAAALLPAVLAGCGGGAEATPAPSAPAPTAAETAAPELAAVDYAHAPEGYILARRGAGGKKWKLRVVKDTEYTYDLTGPGWTAVPLSEGDGDYVAAVFEQVEGETYRPVAAAEFTVELDDPRSPFLRPNQQVNYTAAPRTLAKAAELTEGAEGAVEKAERIYAFVSSTLTYDGEWAAVVESGYTPDLDGVLQKEKGICLDFAALMTAMVRSQSIPCRLAVGDAGSVYHAWAEVWNGEKGEWVRYDPTFAASGKDVGGVKYTPQFYY